MEKPINILIVDDEPKNLIVLETVLDDPGYRLVRANSGAEALLALVVEEFALLILDIQMPNMTGFELAQMIKDRRRTAHVPIIFLTAYYNESQHVLEGYDTGAVDYLHKPINPIILRSKVAVFAELYRKSREVSLANRTLLSEITERRRAEEELRQLNATLDERVKERTEALQTSEAKFRQLLESAPDGMVIIDQDGTIVLANAQTEQLFGYNRADLLGQSVEMLIPDRYRSEHSQERGSFAATSQSLWMQAGRELLGQRKDGSEFSMDVSFRPLETREGTLLFSAIRDVTERKALERALCEADRRKDEFLAMLAHELRNPMAAISGAVELLKRPKGGSEALSGIGSLLQRQTRQMNRLIDDLLDVSRISRGKIDLRKQRTDLVELVGQAIDSVRPLCESMGHDLVLQLSQTPIFVNGDSVRLIQVIGNLLNNACKFTNRGGRIHIIAEREGEDALIRVSDNGIGIEPAQLESIFGLFSQADTSLHRPHAGLGIGLSLVKSLTEMHGGTVEAKSLGAGFGSEFIIHLPVLPDSSALHSEVPITTRVGAATSKHRVLIVDDNVDAAHCLSLLLSSEGHDIELAHDGEAAVDKALSWEPDVILLDLGLPKMDGYEACRRIRELPSKRRPLIAALTGWAQDEDRERTKAAGCDAHLSKPVDLETLTNLLNDIGLPK